MATLRNRIPRSIMAYYAFMKNTVFYLLQSTPGVAGSSGRLNWQRLGWLDVEMNTWSSFLNSLEPLFLQYTDKKTQRTSHVTHRIKKLIRDTVDYEQGLHLLDRIAINPDAGSMDFETFNIKRGTFLQDRTFTRGNGQTDLLEPIMEVLKINHLVHRLLVIFSGSKARSLPKGIKEILVYCVVTAASALPPPVSSYQYVGDVKRGLYNCMHESGSEGQRAWYLARVKNARGEFGPWSAPVSAVIA